MKSLVFDFGTNMETKTEGKGIDWMLDHFVQKKVTGQAGFDYEIVRTRPDIVVELLNEKYEDVDAKRILQSYEFHTLFLNMSIKINEPNIWTLSWARFEFEIDESDASVLSFAPNVDGVKTTIEKNGSRELNLSLTGEIDLPIGIGSKITPDISYDKKNGWTVKFDATVEEVKGFKQRTTNGRVNLQWDIYKNKAIQVPESNLGVTSGAYATSLISTPKGSDSNMNVKVSGETLRRGTSVRSHGIIELASRAMFSIEPTL
jgi:hypothetical protein